MQISLSDRQKAEEVLAKDRIMIEARRKTQDFPMHDHSFLELTYIVRGSCVHTLDGQITTLSPGDYLIVDYGSKHSYHVSQPDFMDHIDCLFLPELLDPILKGTKSLRTVLEHYLLHFNMQALVQNPARMVFHDDTGNIYQLLIQMQRENAERKAGYISLIRCHLLEILLLTMRKLDDSSAASGGQNIISFITAYVSEHYMEPITLQGIASRLNYSLPYISKRFRDEVGVTFVHYLQNYRVMQGCRLLASSNKTLTEIASCVGYHDVRFFSELVKRSTGLSPTDFRRQNGIDE